jgi:hypothetical protein
LVGDSSGASISNIEVSGDVHSGSHSAGGVAGYFSGGTAQNIVSKANVTGGTDAVGGFAGSSGCGAVISDSYATGTITGGSYVGGFSGSDGCEGPGSTMTNVWATGNVVATGGSVGGLIGTAGLTTITEVYATGAVTADADNVGGLVGYLGNSSSISRSFSSSATNAAVSSPSSNIVGGLVGYADSSTVIDSYARRNVTGSDQVAGLVGYAQNATITNTYATGALTGLHFPINGLIIADSTSVVDSFWDKDTTGTTTNYGAIGLTTALMQTPSTFTDAGWNSTTVWSLVNGAYPCLRWSDVSCADDDGVDVETEAAAPNSGDANNDGTLDSQQSNVTSVLSPTSNKYVTLESTCTSNYNVQIGGQAAGSPDGSYSYPAGLIGFVLKGCTVGGTATITQYYYGTYDLSKISMRKWQDNTYKTVPGAVFTNVTIGGQPAVKVVYQITDGSSLDDDGIADGNIVDPAGMAVLAAATTVSAPNTGIEPQSTIRSIILIATSLMLSLAIYGKSRGKTNSN